MNSTRTRLVLVMVVLILLALVAGCRDEDEELTPTPLPDRSETRVARQPTATGTPTATATLRPSNTPTTTPTPTITPTPTPTIPPISLAGDPLALAAQAPEPQPGTPCGIVDFLDFPVDPPDGESVSRGGRDFNVFRDRYDGYHAGEDWWGPVRRASFGEPVYSIGHGQVTFAHPYGWGIDQGTVIIRHVLPDGSDFFSFYGHLDPPGVVLKSGECVARGDLIGQIGRPRSSPHLHFEIRTHTPYAPGPGYWSIDPRLDGWLAPSETIWNRRLAVSPGLEWSRPFVEPGTLGVGLWNENTLVAIEGPALVGLNSSDGSVRWRQVVREEEQDEEEEEARNLAAAVFDDREPLVYTADSQGRLAAFRLPPEVAAEESDPPSSPELLWDLQFHNLRGVPHLMPLPGGGVALAVQRRMIALSPIGALLWRAPFDAQLSDWLLLEDRLLIGAAGLDPSLWTVDENGLAAWPAAGGGQLAPAGSQLFLYAADGLYELDPASQTASLVFPLSDALPGQGDALALPDGTVLLAHMDRGGRRLLLLNEDGSLRWQRAYADLLAGQPQLLFASGQVYLLSEERTDTWSRVSLYTIALEDGALTLIFSSGTRQPVPGGTWALPNGGHLLLNVGGGNLVALDPHLAAREVCAGGPVLACAPHPSE